MRYTLLVIDMQPHANFASTRNLEAVKAAIRLAMRDGNPIVFTEVTHWGDTDFPPTHRVLLDMVKGYPHLVPTIGKSCSSAALHVKNSRSAEIVTENFVLTGCNTDACALATAVGSRLPDGTPTAYGLVDFFPDAEIIVLKDACDTISAAEDPFAGFAGYPSIRLVNTVEGFEQQLSA